MRTGVTLASYPTSSGYDPVVCQHSTCQSGHYYHWVSGYIYACSPCPTTVRQTIPTGCEGHTTLVTTTPAAPKTAAPSTPSPAPAPSAPAAPASPEIPSYPISTQPILCRATPKSSSSLPFSNSYGIVTKGEILSNFDARFIGKLMNFSDDNDDSYFVEKLKSFADARPREDKPKYFTKNKPKDFFHNVQADIENEIDCYICFNDQFYGDLPGFGRGCHDCVHDNGTSGDMSGDDIIYLTRSATCEAGPCAGTGLADLSICVAGGVNSENIVTVCENASLKQLESFFTQIKVTKNNDLKNAIQNAADAKAHSEKLERERASKSEIAAVETELTARCRILAGLIR